MSVIRLTIDEWLALPEAAHHAPDGTWINQPSFDQEGFALIEDSTLTTGDETVLKAIAAAPERIPALKVNIEEAKVEKDELPAKTKDDLYAWRLDILEAYPEAVAKIEADKVDAEIGAEEMVKP